MQEAITGITIPASRELFDLVRLFGSICLLGRRNSTEKAADESFKPMPVQLADNHAGGDRANESLQQNTACSGIQIRVCGCRCTTKQQDCTDISCRNMLRHGPLSFAIAASITERVSCRVSLEAVLRLQKR